MTAHIPNIRIKTNSLLGLQSFPLTPVEGWFAVLDHNGLDRPADSVRVHAAAIAAGVTHTFTSTSKVPDKLIPAALKASGWTPPRFLATHTVLSNGRKTAGFVFGTSKA